MLTDQQKQQLLQQINTVIATDIDQYFKTQHPNENDILDLANTLKHLANPASMFPDEIPNQLRTIRSHLADPSRLTGYPLALNDQQTLRNMLYVSLNQYADNIVANYQLTVKMEQGIAVRQQNAKDWWNSKTERERQTIQEQYNQLSEEQKREMFKRYQENARRNQRPIRVYVYQPGCYNPYAYDPFFWYDFTRCSADLLYLSIRGMAALVDLSWRSAGLATHVVAKAPLVIAHSGGGSSSSCCSGGSGGGSGGGNGDGALVFLAIVALVAIVGSGLIGWWYAGTRFYDAATNILKKPARSLAEIVGISTGIYVGFVKGALVGAAIGSVIPGIGTMAGAVIGALFGAGITAAIGSCIAQTATNVVTYFKDNNTDSTKYALTRFESDNLNHRFDLNSINALIQTIRAEKRKQPIFWLNDAEKAYNEKLDTLMENIKTGDVANVVSLAGKTFYLSKQNVVYLGGSNAQQYVRRAMPAIERNYVPRQEPALAVAVSNQQPAYLPPAYTPPEQPVVQAAYAANNTYSPFL